MAEIYLATGADLTSVSDAIRAKGGTSAPLEFPAEFVSAIGAIPTGKEEIVLNATTNGTYTPPSGKVYGSATVNVPTYKAMMDSIISRTITELDYEITTVGNNAFYSCGELTKASLPTTISIGNGAFQNCSKLKLCDLGIVQSLGTNVFAYCSIFNTLIIRTNQVCPLQNINVFVGTFFAINKTGGKLYVPASLITSYKAAANWDTLFGDGRASGYANNQILAIEGSPYEE